MMVLTDFKEWDVCKYLICHPEEHRDEGSRVHPHFVFPRFFATLHFALNDNNRIEWQIKRIRRFPKKKTTYYEP